MSEIQIITLTRIRPGKGPDVLRSFAHLSARLLTPKWNGCEHAYDEGMRYTLLQVNGHNAGMIEYLPGEYAWRGIEAEGYLFIHCFWVIGSNRGHGYGRQLLETCLADARGTNGVAVVVSKTHWLPTPKLFLKNGFELADQAAPSFDLLVKRFNPEAPLPRFKHSVKEAPTGLTLYHSDQCPYTQNLPDITLKVGEQLKIPVNIIHVDSAKAAQESPCPYGTLAYFFNGELLTYRPSRNEKITGIARAKNSPGKSGGSMTSIPNRTSAARRDDRLCRRLLGLAIGDPGLRRAGACPAGQDYSVYGLIYDIHIDDDGLVRQLVTAGNVSAEVMHDNRERRIVPVEMSVLAVGYEQDGKISHLLPPRPPLSLDVIYLCSDAELARFTERREIRLFPPHPAGQRYPDRRSAGCPHPAGKTKNEK